MHAIERWEMIACQSLMPLKSKILAWWVVQAMSIVIDRFQQLSVARLSVIKCTHSETDRQSCLTFLILSHIQQQQYAVTVTSFQPTDKLDPCKWLQFFLHSRMSINYSEMAVMCPVGGVAACSKPLLRQDWQKGDHWILCLPACYTSIGVWARLGEPKSYWWQPMIASPSAPQQRWKSHRQLVLSLLGLISMMYWWLTLDDWFPLWPQVKHLWFQVSGV